MSNFFKTWTLANVNSLNLTVDQHPAFDYSEAINAEREIHESEAGYVRQSKLNGGAYAFDLSLDYVTSSDVSQIRTWWRNQTTVRFTTAFSDGTARYADCRVVNKNDPFSQHQRWEFSKFKGKLDLISVIDYNSERGLAELTLLAPYFTLATSDGILGINILA